MKYIHLHNHSDYSILDGAITIDKLISKTIEQGLPGVALTDHGNMFGAIEFYQKANKAGIKPILGEEFYVAPESRFKKDVARGSGEDTAHHLILLAENEEGYKNLLKLSSIGYTEGFYYKPRIDMEVLEKHSKGLICSSACISGEIPRAILRNKFDDALNLAGRYKELFGKDRFYLELQDHGISIQETANKGLIEISKKLDIPLIVANDAHYVNKSDAYAHEVLLCNQTGKTMNDKNRMRFSTEEFYLKSPEEMYRIFPDYKSAYENTYKIFEMVDLKLDLDNPILPEFKVPEGYNLDSYLRHLVEEGAKINYKNNLNDKVKKRIDYELSVITSMNFSGYFLIVWDVIKQAKSMKIPVGPGRGSAAGSIVSYCLGITALDPLKYDLLFERFLNPDRNEMPDMDLDFCAIRREEIIDYVKDKYGRDKVSQIITFNKMKAKAVVKDVARAFDFPFKRSNEISKMIEDGDNLSDTIKKSKDFKKLSMSEEGKNLIDISLKLENLVKSAGKHAAGVVISRGPLTDFVPLYKDKDGSISSQYEKNTLETAGLVKMDFLGLKNLTIIDDCLKLIEKTAGEKIDIENIPLDDKKTFDLFQRADTKGVFQLESGGMQTVLKSLAPTSFDDIIAIVALYRPGPLNSGMTEDFVKRKNDPKLIDYPHPLLEPVLKDTLGVIVYQEQVMRISQVMGGFTLPEADKLRKAMGKKKMEIIDELEPKFMQGSKERNIDLKLAKKTYSNMKKFGEYGFNKSHSAAYALVTFQTAYLKAHFPLQYMATLLSAQNDKQKDIVLYVNDCKNAGIALLPPSINKSYYNFTIEGEKIRFGLGAIKGAGEKAINDIVASREKHGEFKSLKEFFENVSTMVVNKGVLEAFIKSGCFDSILENRKQLFDNVEFLLEVGRKLKADKISGQGDLFGGGDDSHKDDMMDIPMTEFWSERERLYFEKEILGIYMSGHPLKKFEKEIKNLSAITIDKLSKLSNKSEVSIIGLISNLAVRTSQKGKQYAIGIIEDLESSIEIMVFGKVLKDNHDLLFADEPLLVTGEIEVEGDKVGKLFCKKVKPLKDFTRESISAVHIDLNSLSTNDGKLKSLKLIFQKYRGDCPVYFHVYENIPNIKNKREKIIKAHASFNVDPSENFIHDLSEVVYNDSVRYSIS